MKFTFTHCYANDTELYLPFKVKFIFQIHVLDFIVHKPLICIIPKKKNVSVKM